MACTMTQNPNIKMNKIQVKKKKKNVALTLPNISPINPIFIVISAFLSCCLIRKLL